MGGQHSCPASKLPNKLTALNHCSPATHPHTHLPVASSYAVRSAASITPPVLPKITAAPVLSPCTSGQPCGNLPATLHACAGWGEAALPCRMQAIQAQSVPSQRTDQQLPPDQSATHQRVVKRRLGQGGQRDVPLPVPGRDATQTLSCSKHLPPCASSMQAVQPSKPCCMMASRLVAAPCPPEQAAKLPSSDHPICRRREQPLRDEITAQQLMRGCHRHVLQCGCP